MEPIQPDTTPTLFQGPSVFAADYIPKPAPSRTAPMEPLAFNLHSGRIGVASNHVICRGLPGSGKTTCVRALFAEIEEKTSRFIPVYVNCRVDQTPDAIFSRFFAKLTGQLPAEEIAEWDIMEAVTDLLLERKAVPVVCLDDIAYLGSRSEINHILYVLLRMHERYPGVKVGVVAIVNDLTYNPPPALMPASSRSSTRSRSSSRHSTPRRSASSSVTGCGRGPLPVWSRPRCLPRSWGGRENAETFVWVSTCSRER